MAKWMRELNLLPEWREAVSKSITPEEMAGVIAKRLRMIRSFGGTLANLDLERDEIANRFDQISESGEEYAESFNDVMESLYDWADFQVSGDFFNAKKVCWVRTF